MGALNVIVVGAGVIGVTTAHALCADGHQVTLLEATPTAARGTSHANGGLLSAAFCAPWAMPGLPRQAMSALFDRAAPFRWRLDGSMEQLRWLRDLLANCRAEHFARHRQRMVQLALRSLAELRVVARATGVAFDLRESGVLQLMERAPPDALIHRRLEALHAFGLDAQWCEPARVQELEPALSSRGRAAWGLLVRDEACGDCERFVQGLLAWNRARGLRFVPEAPVETLELDRSGRRLRAVRTPAQRWEADAFVFATGVDTARILRPHLRLPVIPVKGYSVNVPLPGNEAGRGLVGPQRAVIDDTTKLAVAPLGSCVRLAGMAEVVGHDRSVDASRCEQLVQHYESLYGLLPPGARSHWAGLRPMTPDGTPIIGSTRIEALYLNTGHGTYGWTLACGSARLLADVLAGRSGALDPADYALDPARRGRP
jgi:D-amino-acid dehydrogenase